MSLAFLGIDPGKSGGLAILKDGQAPFACKMPETERDIFDQVISMKDWADGSTVAVLEKVGAMPGNGIASSWKFAEGYGGLKMALTAAGIKFILAPPNKWQGELSCRTKGDKNVTKRKAQQLFPELKITHATADALLIAQWGKSYAKF